MGIRRASKARKDLEKAISLSPEDPYVNYVMANFLLDYGYVLYDKGKEEALNCGKIQQLKQRKQLKIFKMIIT